MKRIASGFQNRQGYPSINPATGQIDANASDAESRHATGLTIEALRKLSLPPFPGGVDVTTCAVVARIARTGFAQANSDTDLAQLLRFCTKHACADALLWFLLQSDSIRFWPRGSDLNPQQVRYLIACLDRLPAPVKLIFDDTRFWPEQCWDAFIDALPSSKGIREINDPWRSYSEQELAQLFAAIEDHPVLCELYIGLSPAIATTLNAYLPRASSLRKLAIRNRNIYNDDPALDFSVGLLANRSLTRIELYDWLITPAMAHALAAPGKALTEVLLGRCSFAPGAITAFASALANNDTMSSVHIPGFPGDASDLKPIYGVLKISADKAPFSDMAILWKMLQVNLTLCEFILPPRSYRPWPNEEPYPWSLRPHVRQRLAENRELPLFADQYFMAKLALSTLPVNRPYLPPEVSAHIARFLLKTDASGLPSYRTLHMLALHKEVKSQHKPDFPPHLDLASHPDAQRLALSGKQALPLPPDVMRSIALLCIRHRATEALNWLVVHASKGELDLRQGQFMFGEISWLINWTRAAPCYIKLRLDQVALTSQDKADIARQLCGNHALTTLSLKGCALSKSDLAFLSEVLMSNTALRALLLSHELMSPSMFLPDPPRWPAQLPNDLLPSSNQAVHEVPASLQPTPPSALQVHVSGLPALAIDRQATCRPRSPSDMSTDQPSEVAPFQPEEADLDLDFLLTHLHAADAENMPPSQQPNAPSTLSLNFLDSPKPNDVLQVPGVLAGPTPLPFSPFLQNDRKVNDLQEERFPTDDEITWLRQNHELFAKERDMSFYFMPTERLLAIIEFALRRNSRLHDGEKVPDALFVDRKFLFAMMGLQLES